MAKNERLDLASAIEQYLSMKQKDNAKNIRKSVRRKKRKDLKWGDRIAAFFDLHFHKSRAIDLANLITSFKAFNSSNVLYTLPDGLKEDLEYIGANILGSEFSELNNSINSALIHSNDTVRRDFSVKNEALFKSLKKAKLESKNITYWQDGKAINTSLEAGLISLGNQKLTRLHDDERECMVAFDIDSVAPIDLPLSEEESYLTGIEEMVRKGEMQESDITRNIKSIRENLKMRKKLEFLSNKVWNVICVLKKESKNNDVDFSRANRLLQTIYDRCRRQIDRCDAYLVQFDFTSLQEKVEWIREKREQEAWVQNHLEALDNVEKVSSRNPEVVEQIKRSNMLTQAAKKDLRELAMADLLANGCAHQHNGDVVTISEHLVREKIDEMISVATQSPGQRAINYLKSMGIKVSDSAEPEALQAESYASIFSDDAYSFDVGKVREIKEIIDSQRSAKATAICRDYMRYRASVEGSASVTFSEYARAVYLQENMELAMVDKAVRDMDLALFAEERQEKKVI